MAGGRLLTFLFTDVVDSTRLLSALGDRRFDAVRTAHFADLREALRAHDGVEVKTLGDGVLATFESPAAAVACSVEMQRSAYAQDLGRPDLRLGLRVGINAGEVTLEDGDVFGTAVVMAKRLCDAAEAGQVLTSSVVPLMAGGRLDHVTRDVDPRVLKGLDGTVPACEVVWAPIEAAAADPPPPLPAAVASTRRPAFVARERELAVLRDALDEVRRSGTPRLVAVRGEPGIGKTRLVATFGQEAHAAGAAVLAGRCPEEGLVPHHPFVAALEHHVRHTPPEVLRRQLGRHGAELLRLVPALVDHLTDLAAVPPGEPEGQRFRLFEAVRHLLAAASAARPVVLILDDLHWADESTLLLLDHLVRGPESGGLLVVGTLRAGEATDARLRDRLADAHRDGALVRLDLAGLRDGDLDRLVREHTGPEAPDDLVNLVAQQSDGNPFFAGELVRHLAECGQTPHRSADFGLPDEVREVVVRRLRRLDAGALEVLQAASVLGREFRLRGLARLAAVADRDVPGAVSQALAAGLVEESSGPAGRYRFTHALIREALYRELPAPRRAALHLDALQAVLRVDPAPRGERLVGAAHHALRSAEVGDALHAADLAFDAAEWLTAQVAYEEATSFARAALDVLDSAVDDVPDAAERRGPALLVVGEACWRAGRPDDARAAFLDAAQRGRQQDQPTVLAGAALGLAGPFTCVGAPDPVVLNALEDALKVLPSGERTLRARVMGRLAEALTFTAERERRERLAAEALALAEADGDPSALADVLGAVTWARWSPDDIERREAQSRAAIRASAHAGDAGLATYSHSWRLAVAIERGDRFAADAEIAEEAEEVERLGRPSQRWQLEVHRAMLALLEGRLQEADERAVRAMSVAPHQTNAIQMFGVQLLFLRREQDRLDEVVDLIAQHVDALPEIPAWRCGWAWACVQIGRRDDAASVLADQADRGLDRLPRDAMWLPGVLMLADVCASLGAVDAAPPLRDALSPFADRVFVVAPVAVCAGPVARPLARLHALLGEHAAARREFDRAEAVAAALRSVPYLGHVNVDRGEAALRHGDDRTAAGYLERAREIAREGRLPYLARAAEEVAARAGLAPAPVR